MTSMVEAMRNFLFDMDHATVASRVPVDPGKILDVHLFPQQEPVPYTMS